MIRISNVYYMLSYAYNILQEHGYEKFGEEEFENTADLLSAILVKSSYAYVKRGIEKAYIDKIEALSRPQGKICLSQSVSQRTLARHQLVCEHDEYSSDCYPNQILKTTMQVLLKNDISKERKNEIKKLLIYFAEVSVLDYRKIQWKDQFSYRNKSVQMQISICYLILNGFLQSKADGSMKLMDFMDEQRMCRLYEKFILEYYKKEFPQLHARASKISWELDDDNSYMLPSMQSDIMLTYQDKVLIIDAKYYEHTTQTHFNKKTIHSANLYQIFTYVKNKAVSCDNVSGMLLYAKTDEAIQPDSDFMMSGNKISVRTLDLGQEFANISCALNKIADDFMNN